MGTGLRGEMSSLPKEEQSQIQFSFIEKLAEAMRLSSAEVSLLDNDLNLTSRSRNIMSLDKSVTF